MQNGAGTSRQSPSLEASRCKGAFLMALMDYIGYAAAACTTSAYIQQVTRVWRTRSTKDISLKMFLVLITGLALWLTYGFLKSEVPIIAANDVTLMLAGTILFFKLKHG
jgi:MtN3 and saliva related transmembrane protein